MSIRDAFRQARNVDTARAEMASWCDRNNWCPTHDRAKGSCPKITRVIVINGRPTTHYDDCPGR